MALKKLGKRLFRKCSDEEGSISLLIIGLFIVTLFSIMAMTDIASIAIAQRSLVQASEAASQRGTHELDLDNYYKGKGTIFTPLIRSRYSAPNVRRIPINCSTGYSEVIKELHDWSVSSSAQKRIELDEITLESFECDGFAISIGTRVIAQLPFVIPLSSFRQIELHADVATENQRSEGFYLFGLRLY
ncbi:MAG: hypothetical protein NTZ06_04255 [Actinobacteria bacterium]|nr:hypothetical protein [Actinomycetota bacterium]